MRISPRLTLVVLTSLLACGVPRAFSGVTVSSPAKWQRGAVPVHLSANASTCSSQPVVSMGYSFDSSSDTTVIYNDSIQASVSSATGAHTLHVKAWGNKGASWVTDVALNVAGVTSGANTPSDATAVSAIQTLSNWQAVNDTATGGGYSSGSTKLEGSPSLSGQARQFSSNLASYGGVCYFASFGDDESAADFLYDGFIYINNSASNIANLEMDLNQVMPNGQTVIFGFQCDGWSNTWDYTANTGSAQAPCGPMDTLERLLQPAKVEREHMAPRSGSVFARQLRQRDLPIRVA